MKRALVMAVGLVLAVAVVGSAQAPQTPAPTAPKTGTAFVDANGDGICDNFQAGTPKGNGYGQGRGRGTHVGPQDGTGFGAGKGAGGGICDGTGPKGARRGGRR